MIHTLTCPVCNQEIQQLWSTGFPNALLSHLWWHLASTVDHHHAGVRFCWCGKSYGEYRHWFRHMEGKDAQAHYLAHALGINR